MATNNRGGNRGGNRRGSRNNNPEGRNQYSSSVMSSTGAMTTMVNSRTRGAVLACVIADPPGRARYEQTSFQSRILIVTQYNRKVTTKLMVFIFKKAQICPAPWA